MFSLKFFSFLFHLFFTAFDLYMNWVCSPLGSAVGIGPSIWQYSKFTKGSILCLLCEVIDVQLLFSLWS